MEQDQAPPPAPPFSPEQQVEMLYNMMQAMAVQTPALQTALLDMQARPDVAPGFGAAARALRGPQCDGNEPPPREWITRVQRYLVLQRVDLARSEAAALAGALLTGRAAAWFDAVQQAADAASPFPDFTVFAQAFLEHHEALDHAEDARQRLDNLRQRGTVDEYVTAFNALMVHVPDMAPRDQLHRFLMGLETDLRLHLATRELTTLQRAATSVARARRTMHAMRPAPAAGRPGGFRPRAPAPAPAAAHEQPMELGNVERQGNDKGNIICHNCRQPGHVGRHCPHPRSGGQGNTGAGRGRPGPAAP